MEPKVFKNERFGEVLATIEDGKVYILGDDVVKALKLPHGKRALAGSITSCSEFIAVDNKYLMAGPEIVKRLVEQSDEGKAFAEWIKDEVEFALKLLDFAERGLSDDERADVLSVEADIRRQQSAELRPARTYYSIVLENQAPITTGELAERYGMEAYELLKKLEEFGILENFCDFALLNKPYMNWGLTRTRLSYDGEDHDSGEVELRWTQAGQLFVFDLLKHKGILPVMEEKTDG